LSYGSSKRPTNELAALLAPRDRPSPRFDSAGYRVNRPRDPSARAMTSSLPSLPLPPSLPPTLVNSRSTPKGGILVIDTFPRSGTYKRARLPRPSSSRDLPTLGRALFMSRRSCATSRRHCSGSPQSPCRRRRRDDDGDGDPSKVAPDPRWALRPPRARSSSFPRFLRSVRLLLPSLFLLR